MPLKTAIDIPIILSYIIELQLLELNVDYE